MHIDDGMKWLVPRLRGGDAIGTLSPDFATLHPGLFSFSPSGRECGI
jgi:hypothetical protein